MIGKNKHIRHEDTITIRPIDILGAIAVGACFWALPWIATIAYVAITGEMPQ